MRGEILNNLNRTELTAALKGLLESSVFYGEKGIVILYRHEGNRVAVQLYFDNVIGWSLSAIADASIGPAQELDANLEWSFHPGGLPYISQEKRAPLPSFANDSRKFDTRGR